MYVCPIIKYYAVSCSMNCWYHLAFFTFFSYHIKELFGSLELTQLMFFFIIVINFIAKKFSSSLIYV